MRPRANPLGIWQMLSIRWKMALAYCALLGLLLAGFGFVVYLGLSTQLEAQATDLARSRAREVAGLLSTSPEVPLQRAVDGFASPGVYVQVQRTSGESAVRSANLADATIPSANPLPGQAAVVTRPSGSDEPERLVVWHEPLAIDGVPSLVEVAVSMAAAILLGLLGTWWLAGRMLNPVDHLTSAAARIGAADLGQRIRYRGPDDEVGRLARTFDDMLARLEASFHNQRRFVADASHELRTPLQAVLGHARLLARRGAVDPALRDEAVTAIIAQGERMRHLIEGLLVLARADETAAPVRGLVHLDELVADVADELALLAHERQVQLHLECGEPASLLAEPDQLRLLVRNLVDNALKFTPSGGRVVVTIARRDHEVVLVVEDSGPGIPVEALPHIFERFYRADPARQTGGAGLGLAIATEVARAHGGRLVATNRSVGGARFEAQLPDSPARSGAPTTRCLSEARPERTE
jgi:two-component system, OmpR family, sensor kinase